MSTIRSVNRPFLNTMNLTKLSKRVHSEANSNRIRRYKFRNIHRREDRIELFSQGSGSICHLIGHNSDVKRVLRFAYGGGVVTLILRGRHYANGGSGAKLIRMQSTPTRVASGKSANCHCARISNVCANIRRCYRRNCAISGVKWSEIYFRIHCRCVHLFQEYIC